jgi:predicted MFS family arabinose efflux permease
MPWRLLAGVTGVTLMVLAPSYLLVRVAPAERGRAGGLVLTGVGLGAALGAIVVAPLAVMDPAIGWLGLTLLAGLAAALTWRRWRLPIEAAPPGATAPARRSLGLVLVLVLLAYATDGAGFVPHTIFWVDFIARELALGIGLGTLNWILFGLGAALGPMTVGALADRLGLARTLMLAFAAKTVAIALPAVAPAPALLALSSIVVGALTPGVASLTAARIAELVPPAAQARSWAAATLAFGLGQAGAAYGMSYAFSTIGAYRPLYEAAAAIEALGLLAALLAARSFARPGRLPP